MNSQTIKVSVACTTYNQKKYIRKTLNSILAQDTNFEYEIIVHDDASTDGTTAIIHEFAEKYPEKIVPIFQKENQFSKGVRILAEIILPCARGQYIAMCEGDDFWTDSQKLQKQYDAMQSHQNCSICVHKVQGVSEDGKKCLRMFPDGQKVTGEISAEEVIHSMLAENKWMFHTTSYFMRKEILQKGNNYEFFMHPVYGDQATLWLAAIFGRFYYIDQVMSSYRMGATGSTVKKDKERTKSIIKNKKWITSLMSFDRETRGMFHSDVEEALKWRNFMLAGDERNYKVMLEPCYRKIYNSLPAYARYHILISSKIPLFDNLYCFIKKMLKKD